MIVFYSPRFLRSFSKLPKDIQDKFIEKEVIFRRNLFDPKLGTHKLEGREDWAFIITRKIRVIFVFIKKDILLVNIGDHSIYRK